MLTIRADEPARAIALLTPPLRARLLELYGVNVEAAVCDTIGEITSSANARWEAATDIEEDIACAASLAALVSEAMRGVPLASALVAHEEAWREFAVVHDMAFCPMPLAMRGQLGAAEVTIRAVRTAKNAYATETSLVFAAPLGLGLHARPRGSEATTTAPSRATRPSTRALPSRLHGRRASAMCSTQPCATRSCACSARATTSS